MIDDGSRCASFADLRVHVPHITRTSCECQLTSTAALLFQDILLETAIEGATHCVSWKHWHSSSSLKLAPVESCPVRTAR